MKTLAILISPQAKSAYFKAYIEVALQELSQVLGITDTEHRAIAAMDFFIIHNPTDFQACELSQLLRLSFTQGLFEIDGDKFIPINQQANFLLHDDFVLGSKYRGKTNEHLTQMLINVGLASIDTKNEKNIKLLDPMCGRGTTLLWAMRYGLDAKGIEQDATVLGDVRQSLKKWSKLHRQKHKINEGFIGKNNKKDLGKFLAFNAEEKSMKLIIGDSRDADTILKGERFHLMVSDLPYGIQHFTTNNTRNPIAVLEECLPAWKNALKPGGAIVLAFNSYIPKRDTLIASFEAAGFTAQKFSAPHRMSESIVRDIVIFKLAD